MKQRSDLSFLWILIWELLLGGNAGFDAFLRNFRLFAFPFLRNEMNAYSDRAF